MGAERALPAQAAARQRQLRCPLKLYPRAFIFSFPRLCRTHSRQAAKLPVEEITISVNLDRCSIHPIFPHMLFWAGFCCFYSLYLKTSEVGSCWLRGLDTTKQMSLLFVF